MNNTTIIFAITCKGRALHIEKTLPANLANNISPYSKFVLLDANSQDHLIPYLKANHEKDIASGKLIVYSSREPGPFHISHAKNMAARLAILEGADLLVTLDADNYTGEGFDEYIACNFEFGTFMQARVVKSNPTHLARGVAGRLVIRAQDFVKAGGYDEKYDTWRGEDMDLNARMRRMGYFPRFIPPRYLDAVRHGPDVRFKEYPHARKYQEEEAFREEMKLIEESSDTVVNFGNFGCGIAYKNFGNEPTVLKPVPTRIFGIGMHKTATTSLHTAFGILGYDSFHWQSGDKARDIWDEMNSFGRSHTMERYYALCDLPIPLLYKKLDEAYPGSKFILTVRNENAWLRSVERLWSPAYNPSRWEWDIYPFSNRIHRVLYGRIDFDPAIFLARYRRHNAEVVEYFKGRPNDLLVLDMDCSDAWQELCRFLEVPKPEMAYPREYGTAKLPKENWREAASIVMHPMALRVAKALEDYFEKEKFNMTWLRSIFGLGAGGLNLLANGTNWKQVLLSLAVAGLGVATHLTSTSGSPVVVSVNPHTGRGSTVPDAKQVKLP